MCVINLGLFLAVTIIKDREKRSKPIPEMNNTFVCGRTKAIENL